MISKKHKIIFIHIPKNAGSSIDEILSNNLDIKRYKRHQNAEEICQQLGAKSYNVFFKFAVIRNPWDRIVSKFFWSQQFTGSVSKKLTFPEYVEKIDLFREKEKRSRYDAFATQMSWIKHDGIVDIDCILRFENLAEDWKGISKKIGMPEYLPHKKKTSHGHYSQVYDNITVDEIARIYHEDIEYFNYDFEDKRGH